MKAVIMIMAGLALVDAITMLLLKREHKKRIDAEAVAEEASYNMDRLVEAQKVQREERENADKKIEKVRDANSGIDKYNAIIDGLSH